MKRLLFLGLLLFSCNATNPSPNPTPSTESFSISSTPSPADFKLAKGTSAIVTVKLEFKSVDVKKVELYSDVTYSDVTVKPLNTPTLTATGEFQFQVSLNQTPQSVSPSFRIYATGYDKDGRASGLVQPSALLYRWAVQ